jgi:hypothetical protein
MFPDLLPLTEFLLNVIVVLATVAGCGAVCLFVGAILRDQD